MVFSSLPSLPVSLWACVMVCPTVNWLWPSLCWWIYWVEPPCWWESSPRWRSEDKTLETCWCIPVCWSRQRNSPDISLWSGLEVGWYECVICVRPVWSLCRSPVRADVAGRMGFMVQRKHRGPDVQEGAGTHRQCRRPTGSQPQPQDPHLQEPPLRGLKVRWCLCLSVLIYSINVTYRHSVKPPVLLKYTEFYKHVRNISLYICTCCSVKSCCFIMVCIFIFFIVFYHSVKLWVR